MGMFDDLIPKGATPPARGGMFDDLIPTAVPASEGQQLSELDRRMDERVAKEAKGGFAPHPSPVEYLPFGSWLDEASAGLDAGLNAVSGGRIGQPYDEAKAYQNARQRYASANASGLEKGIAMAGGMAASLPVSPAVTVMRGATLVPTTVNAAATGAGYGALYGAGEGQGLEERATNALGGAAIGTAVGGAVAPVARGVANAVQYARNRGAPLPHALQNFERGAVNRVADDMAADDLTAARYQTRAHELGNEGMLLDMGENLTGAAETLAQTHGPQRPIIAQALNARRDAAPGRIQDAINNELAPEMNIPQYIANQRQAFNQQAAPHYEQFHNTSIPLTPALRETLRRIPGSAFGEAQRLARADGYQQQFRLRPVDEPMTPMTGHRGQTQEQIPTGIEYDYLKRAVDDLARRADPGSNEQRIYSGLARRLRTEVDTILSPNDPTQSSWARGRRISGDGLEGREAAELGGGVFSGKRDPHQVQAELADLSAHGERLYRYGARNDLRQMMGRGATNFGPRGDNAARRALNSEFSRENLALIESPRRPGSSQRLIGLIDAENDMADSFNTIMSNSATARRQAGQTRLPVGAGAPIRTEAPKNIGEAAFAIARRGVNALLNGALGERAGRIMSDQARLLTARGIDRDIYVQALHRLANTRNATQAQRDAIEVMVRAVGQQTRTPLISSVTQQEPAR